MKAAGGRTTVQNTGLAIGVAALLVALVTEPPAGVTPAAWQVAGTMALMAIWWATEALPFAATALV
ncbi:MAG: anion transporter, partial [Steroidobacteraceae bacterium]